MPTIEGLVSEVQLRNCPFVLRVAPAHPKRATILSRPEFDEIGIVDEVPLPDGDSTLRVALHGRDITDSEVRSFPQSSAVEAVVQFITHEEEDDVEEPEETVLMEDLTIEERIARLEALTNDLSREQQKLEDLRTAILIFLGFTA